MVERYENSLLKIYESEKRKALKTLVNSATNKEEKWKAIKEVVQNDVFNQTKAQMALRDSLVYEEYKTFLNKERLQMESNWVLEEELKELGFGEVIEARENFLKTMESATKKENLQSFRM